MKKLALIMTLIWMLALPVKAHEVPDLTREGSITVTMRYDGKAISGGAMTLHRVGEIQEDDGNYHFVLTAEYADSGITLENVQSAATAKKLADFTKQHSLQGVYQEIATDGTAQYANLKPGLYLLVQKKAAKGFEPTAPFLVTLPMMIGETYIYQVDASPKVSPVPVEKPENPEQPKTGQSGLPIWAFSGSAIALALLLRKKERQT